MHFNLIVLKVLLFICASPALQCRANQPSYQVSLYVRLHPQEPPIHFCNGVIVQSRLILTTASCVHYKFSPNNSPVLAILPSMITIMSGSSTPFNDELMLHVSHIFIADNFNFTTGKNDLALLRLSGILPLDKRPDISWITLEDDADYESPCLANFYVRKSPNGATNYIESEQLPILGPESCRIASEHLIEREHDICSVYYLPTGFDCNSMETLQNYNDVRGTGLLCGNKLIGILSTILPWQNNTDCKEKPISAYFTAAVPHIAWIFSIIGEEDLKMLNEGAYISSMPYQGETNSFIKPQVTASATTLTYTTLDNLQTTEFSAQHNGAGRSTANLKLLFYILGILYLKLSLQNSNSYKI